MGQTLSHGVYLPAEGERNCYSGLASNWNLLDTAIGDTAGKASATHTHGNITNDGKVGTAANKPLITGTGGAVQAGSFGNQANTFCEGNDSRLSDARTPVAHTHTKSDVTDLLNSNFIPSANNSYDLGSSTNQWNNLYAKNYFYNGTAWGLDKNNVWSNINSYQREICISGDRNAYIAPMWEGAGSGSGMAFLVSDASKAICFGTWTDDANNNNRKIIDGTKGRMIIRVGEKNSETYLEVEPRASNAALGNSTNKWKSFNGVNPGALSLPNLTMQTYDPSNGWYNLDTTDWDLTGSPTDISSDVLKDGYLYICLACDSTGYVVICEGVFSYPNCYYSTSGLPISGYARALLPVRRGTDVRLYLKGTSVYSARFFPALGNV